VGVRLGVIRCGGRRGDLASMAIRSASVAAMSMN
jgi:hypothetical protein